MISAKICTMQLFFENRDKTKFNTGKANVEFVRSVKMYFSPKYLLSMPNIWYPDCKISRISRIVRLAGYPMNPYF